jgi:glycosyltransferase involved in cell wall biosynthesis
LFMAQGIAGLASATQDTPLRVLDVDDLESAKARRDLAALSWHKPRKWLLALDHLKLRRYESRTLRRFHQALVCSDPDRDALAPRMGKGEAVTYRNGADLDIATHSPNDDGRTLLFFGALDYGPNVDAALHLVQDIWPRIRAALPGARLEIAGKSPCAEVRALDNGGDVRVSGYVSDKAALFASVTATVVPIRSGGGTRIKILEAMAMGKAVVSTTVGCEGIDVVNGENILIGDCAEDLAGACLRVLGDTALRSSLAEQGRALVRQKYGWPAIRREFAARVRTLVERRRLPEGEFAGAAALPVR